MRGIRIVTLAIALFATAGVSSASATTWSTQTLPVSTWFAGATNWNNRIIQAGGFGFPGGKESPVPWTREYGIGQSPRSLNSMPGARIGDAVVTGLNGYVYAIGGLNAAGTVQGQTMNLSPTALRNRWMSSASLPIPRVALSAAVVQSGRDQGDIFTMGGDRKLSNGSLAATAVVEFYNPTSNSWNAGPALPITLDDTSAASVGSTIYVFGGFHPGRGASELAYSLDTNTPGASWVALPAMPSAADLPGAAADPTDADGSIYVAGGANGSADLRRVDVYDPVLRTWSCIRPMPASRVGAPAVTVLNGSTETLTVTGGLDGNLVENTLYYAPTGLDTSDVTPPVVTSTPVPAIVSGIQGPAKGFQASLSWKQSDQQTDILNDNLDVNGGTGWVATNDPWGAAREPKYFIWNDIAHVQYRVAPTDCGGNAAPTVTGPQFSTHVYSESSLHYAGSWGAEALTSAQGGHYRASSQTGAVASFKFTGRDIGWLAAKGPTRGQAYVAVDGVRVAVINLYAKSVQARDVVWHKAYGSFGTHTLTIKVVGTKGHPSVDVDSLFVIGQPIGTVHATAHALTASHLAELTDASAGPARRVARP